jgi:hypothetical protein
LPAGAGTHVGGAELDDPVPGPLPVPVPLDDPPASGAPAPHATSGTQTLTWLPLKADSRVHVVPVGQPLSPSLMLQAVAQ